jgi:hypothetical protein
MSTIEITDLRDDTAKVVIEAWDRLNFERTQWLQKGMEARRYVTASSTNDTEVGSRPWANKTTIPKLTQIRDNLASFYMAALMPSDDWFRFEGMDIESHQKANIIEQYMATKLRMGGFRKALEQMVNDWILYGNCFGGITWERSTTKSLRTGEDIVNFVGPKLFRISPLDCVIDKRAPSFEDSIFIKRSFVSIADIIEHNEKNPEIQYNESVVDQVKILRSGPSDDILDFYKSEGYQIDGFQSFEDYLSSQYIEILEYWGDILIRETGEVKKNQVVIIADRSFTLAMTDNPTWNGRKPFVHTGWRILPDNLYGQSPLDNLVGMQYRCDHLENLKADTFDQIVHPVVIIKGDQTEGFQWGPGVQHFIPPDGDVEVLRPDATVLQADNQIAIYHNYMEQMAGSPKESMGFRTPGEKTAFEVSALQQGADRMFQDKLNRFETHAIEPALEMMFEMTIRNLDVADIARVFNDDTKSLELTKLTKEDVVADGVFRAVGAKHFAARNKRVQEMQNFQMIMQNPTMAPHFSGMRAAKAFEEELGFEKYGLVEENIAVREQMMTQMETQQMQQQLQQTMGGVEGAEEELEELPPGIMREGESREEEGTPSEL